MMIDPTTAGLAGATPKEPLYERMEVWSSLIFGRYSIQTVLAAVKDPEWQTLRVSLKGTSLAHRYVALTSFLVARNYSDEAKVIVTNYVYALKRGGMIK